MIGQVTLDLINFPVWLSQEMIKASPQPMAFSVLDWSITLSPLFLLVTTLILIAGGIAAGIWLKRGTARRILSLRTKAEGNYAMVLAISLLRFLQRNFIPILTSGLLFLLIHLLNFPRLLALTLASSVLPFVGYWVVRSLLQELFDPRGKVYRLLPFDEKSSLRLYRWSHTTLLVIVVPLVLSLLLEQASYNEAAVELCWLVFKVGLFVLMTYAFFLHKTLFSIPMPQKGLGKIIYQGFSRLYYPLVVAALILLGLSMVGFQNLARMVFERAGAVSLLLLGALMVKRILSDQIRARFSATSARRESADLMYGIVQEEEKDFQKALFAVTNLALLWSAITILARVFHLNLSDLFGGGLWNFLTHPLLKIGEAELTLWNLIKAVFVFLIFLYSSKIVRGLLNQKIYPRLDVDPGIRTIINTFVHYALLAVGAMTAIGILGVHTTTLAVFAGAFGVGLGFGLQNIANNFVSGLILLFERPVKRGDFVKVSGEAGVIQKIGARSTIINTTDNITLIVPNSEFISMTVTNLSHRDPKTRIRIPISVACGSDVAKVDQALLDIARDCPKVMKDPPPDVSFKSFGENALNFELLVWVANPLTSVNNEINRAIDKKFRELGIEIPFPQRDIHFRTAIDVLQGK